jgi:hypothetical protein
MNTQYGSAGTRSQVRCTKRQIKSPGSACGRSDRLESLILYRPRPSRGTRWIATGATGIAEAKPVSPATALATAADGTNGWPVMPVVWNTFELRPFDFFGRNPALRALKRP